MQTPQANLAVVSEERSGESEKSGLLRRLVALYGVDVGSAALASTLVSPFVAIVDKSIISQASGRQRLMDGIKEGFASLLSNPLRFYRQTWVVYVWGVYMGTYLTANSIDTTFVHFNQNPQWPKFLGTTAANIWLCVWKDQEFAKMFGTKAPTRLPRTSYSLFLLRDTLTIGSSFNFPLLLSQRWQELYGLKKSYSDIAAQIITPCAVQFISTPLHLTALDLYNRPRISYLATNSVDISSAERFKFLRNEYPRTLIARMARIFPAFGIGGVGNSTLRKHGRAFMGH